jgi:hypothetical protein
MHSVRKRAAAWLVALAVVAVAFPAAAADCTVGTFDLLDYIVPSCSARSTANKVGSDTFFTIPLGISNGRGRFILMKGGDTTGFEEWYVDNEWFYIKLDTTWAWDNTCVGSGDDDWCDTLCGTGNGGCGTCKHRWKQADADDHNVPFAYTVYSTPNDSGKPGARWVMRKVNLPAGQSCEWAPDIAIGAGNWRTCAGCSTNFDSSNVNRRVRVTRVGAWNGFPDVIRLNVVSGPGQDEVYHFAKGVGWVGFGNNVASQTGINDCRFPTMPNCPAYPAEASFCSAVGRGPEAAPPASDDAPPVDAPSTQSDDASCASRQPSSADAVLAAPVAPVASAEVEAAPTAPPADDDLGALWAADTPADASDGGACFDAPAGEDFAAEPTQPEPDGVAVCSACNNVSIGTPANATVCAGSSKTFSLAGSGGNGWYGYQWYEWNCTGGCAWKPVGLDKSSYTTKLVRSYYVRCSSCGRSANTGIFSLANYPAPTTTTPTSVTVCPGVSKTFTLTPGGGNGSYAYRWFEWNCDNGCSWKQKSTASTYTTNLVRTFYANVSSCSQSVNSGQFSLANYPAVTTTTPASVTVCPGTSRTFTVSPGGGNGAYTYEWYEWNCDSGCSWKLKSTASSYTTNLVRTFYVKVKSCSGGQSVNSGQFSLANYAAVTTTTPANATVPAGTSYTFNVTAGGGNGAYTYQWYEWNCTNGCSWKAVGTNSRSYTTNLVRTYYVNVKSCGGAQSVNSGQFTLSNTYPTLQEAERPPVE